MRHATAQPAYICGLALLVLLLIPAWVALGVYEATAEEQKDGPGGHEMMMGGRMSKEFGATVQAYIAANTREDGCVVPAPAALSMDQPMQSYGAADGHGAATSGTNAMTGEKHSANNPPATHGSEPEPVSLIYLQALQFGYLPAKLCVQAGKTYEVRMMATDVIHGASIQLGPGSRMIRLPRGVPVIQQMTFTQPGTYLIYCSFYCGVGHPYMQASIVVEPPQAPAPS